MKKTLIALAALTVVGVSLYAKPTAPVLKDGDPHPCPKCSGAPIKPGK
jgi:hypothetical protein